MTDTDQREEMTREGLTVVATATLDQALRELFGDSRPEPKRPIKATKRG